MSIPPAWQQRLDFFGPPIIVAPSRAALTSDAGLLPLRQFDEHIGLTRAFAAALDDPRDPALTEHTFLEMVRCRVYGILAAYEDQNDHDTLRHDPVFKLVAGRPPDGDDLASQPTLSRFENAISIASLKRLRDLFIDQFIAAFPRPPRRLTLDLDAVDDPAHGRQQLTFWHGYYDQNQYLPLVITCADNDQLVLLSLRPGNVPAALGADDDLAYLVTRLRQAWPSSPAASARVSASSRTEPFQAPTFSSSQASASARAAARTSARARSATAPASAWAATPSTRERLLRHPLLASPGPGWRAPSPHT